LRRLDLAREAERLAVAALPRAEQKAAWDEIVDRQRGWLTWP
jgi:hypothetical protein